MALTLGLSPAGHLLVTEGDLPGNDLSEKVAREIQSAFAQDPSAGLLNLATRHLGRVLPPSFAYWREYACAYLTELCRAPGRDGSEAPEVPPRSAGELEEWADRAPPMRGLEYLQADVLGSIWRSLDGWVRQAADTDKGGLAAFLQGDSSPWHRVGRVCFHLAENKRDRSYPFAFLATYATGLSEGSRVQYQPLSRALQEYAGARNRKALVALLSPVERAAEASDLVRDLVDSREVFHPLAWSPEEAYRFLKDIPVLEASGLVVRVPDWWTARRPPRPVVQVTVDRRGPDRLDSDAVLDFQVSLSFDGEPLTEKERRALLAGSDGLLLLKGRWVEVDGGKIQEAVAHWERLAKHASANGLSFYEGMRLLAGAPANSGDPDPIPEDHLDWSEVQAGPALERSLRELRSPAETKKAHPGKALKATLRPYQEVGISWLRFVTGLGLGACLADDMGLGKTIQALGLLLLLRRQRKESAPSLLVVPASLLANWREEIERFSPSLTVRFAHPSESSREEIERLSEDPGKTLQGVDLVVTTYAMLPRQPWLVDLPWRLVILDEAQAIKNPAAKQTRTVKKLKAQSRLALTGTPVENRLSDLWSLFDFLNRGLLGSWQAFARFVKALEARKKDQYAPLRSLVRPYILRRMKADPSVVSDLPDKTEVYAYCTLSRKQAALYEESVDQLRQAIGRLEGIQRRGLILSFILRFKQICNHPGQWLGDDGYPPEESGKFQRLQELCETIAARQEKVLLFTQFRGITAPLSEFMEGVFGRPGAVLHGGTPVRKRKAQIDAFQQEDGPPFFVLSLKAGGTGLNLTAATHVVHFDRWWNPAVENQATDRAFRIGQKRNVLVHKFLCRGTIEEKIDALITSKIELAEDLLESGAQKMLTEMDDDELMSLVKLDIPGTSAGAGS